MSLSRLGAWRLPSLPPLPKLRSEHRALLGLIGLGLLGQGARLALIPPSVPPGAFAVPGAATDPLAHRDSARRADTLKPGEKVDADKASAADLTRVPGIGAGLAKRMVAHRAQHGPFGGLAGVDRVPGIGPAKLSRIAPYLAFSGVAYPPTELVTRPGSPRGPMNFGPAPVLEAPASGPTVVGRASDRSLPLSGRPSGGADLNSADSIGLMQFPGIGPAKAGTILRWRTAHGAFRNADDLAKVPGIGPKTAARLWGLGGAP